MSICYSHFEAGFVGNVVITNLSPWGEEQGSQHPEGNLSLCFDNGSHFSSWNAQWSNNFKSYLKYAWCQSEFSLKAELYYISWHFAKCSEWRWAPQTRWKACCPSFLTSFSNFGPSQRVRPTWPYAQVELPPSRPSAAHISEVELRLHRCSPIAFLRSTDAAALQIAHFLLRSATRASRR